MSNNTDKMFDAISIVADSIIKKYQYDKTIEAKIVSTAQKDKGIYKVEYENAIFDAYSSDTQSFYENETVYVNVPQGDFSKQKHIVGRKVDLEKAPDKTFNFKMPFDNFVGLKDLTKDSPYAYGKKGFLANYPPHGQSSEVYSDYQTIVQPYKNALDALEQYYVNQQEVIEQNAAALADIINANFYPYGVGYIIGEHPFGASTYLQAMCTACEQNNTEQLENLIANYKTVTGVKYPSDATYYGTEDKQDLDTAIQAYKDRSYAALQEVYMNGNGNDVAGKTWLLNDLQEAMSIYNGTSYNHLWSWDNTNHEILLESTLGIQLDIQTLLGEYFPQSGDYGLRIEITGTTKATEAEAAHTVTEEIIWTNQQMYGNTYAFYTPYSQQRMLDVSGYISLEHIDIFFYQDHNFTDYMHKAIAYSYANPDGTTSLLPYNIYYDNLKVLVGITTEECKTDKLLLYTHNNLTYGEEIYGADYSANNEKELVLAWVHKIDDSAVLVDTKLADIASNAEKPKALETYDAHIYWYHYEYDVSQDTTDIRQRYGGLNWEYLPDFDDEFVVTVIPDFGKPKERWKAILVYNGVPYVSEPLEFVNYDKSLDLKNQESTNEIVFRLLREKLDGEGNFIVQEDSNLKNFFVYDENNLCIKNDDNIRWADIDYYIQIWIRNTEQDTYMPLPLAIDTETWDVNSFEVEWQAPASNTMLSWFQPVEDSDLENAALTPINGTISDSLKEAIKKCTRKFRIRDRWDMRYIDNTIAAVVNRGNRIYKPQIELLFGQSGNMGSKYTIRIIQDEPAYPCMVQGEKFKVRAVVLDDKNVELSSRHFVFSWKLLAPTIITESKQQEIEGNWKEEFAKINTGDEGNDNIHNTLEGYIRNNYPPVFEVTVRGVDDYPLKTVEGFKLIDSSEINEHYRINVPNKVEFKSDGKAPITINSDFEVYHILPEAGDQQIHPEWWLEQQKLNNDNWETNDPVEYIGLKSTSIVNSELATNYNPVVYYKKPQGQSPDFDAGFSLTSTGELTTAGTYRDLKAAIDQLYEEAMMNDDSYEASTNTKNIYTTRIYNLNLTVNKVIPTYNNYALDPYVNYSSARNVPWEWVDGLTENYYTVIGFNSGNIYFKQAIPFTKNVYSSSLLNTWNGSVTIDENNGAVLAQMIAAGAKDQNNRFTGVMMGDWANYADNSLDTPGLYGFKYGDQVFGFKTDGTGFIGKSGKGRIEFDGNRSLISNSDRTCYLNLDPIIYTTNSNGTISYLNDNNGFSQYFLYAKTPKSSSASLLGEDKLEQSTHWATQFLDDPANDYFIVDPNNGVLTSGGVIARYGKIGNWMISDAGMYQRITADVSHPENNRYMYLGYPGLDTEDIQRIDTEYQTQISQVEIRRQQTLEKTRTEWEWENEISNISQYYKAIFVYDPYHYFNAGWPLKIMADIIDDALDSYDSYYTSLSQEEIDTLSNRVLHPNCNNTLENNILYNLLTDEDRLKQYVTVDDVFRLYHAHYTFSADGEPSCQPNISIYGLNNRLSVIMPIISFSATRDMSKKDFQYNNRFGVPGTLSVNITTIPDASNTTNIMVTNSKYNNIDSYYGTIDQNETWANKWSEYTTTRQLPQIINLYGNILSRTRLAEASAWLRGAYQYLLDAYNDQIDEMIAAAIASGELTVETLESIQQESERQLQNYINTTINPFYNSLLEKLRSKRAKQISDLALATDGDQYAIFAGYTPTDKPLFSVNWRGYMTAREGRIGDTSPWYIGDRGLTQKNNSGTIFLGDPATQSGNLYTTINNNIHQNVVGPDGQTPLELLNNGTVKNAINQGPLVYIENPQNPTGAYIESYGNFAIYAGYLDDPNHPDTAIKFGVRMDGTLLATQGNIGGWVIGNQKLFSRPKSGYDDNHNKIIFDPVNNQLLFGGDDDTTAATVIYGNGALKLSAQVTSDSTGTNAGSLNMGTIDLGGYWLQGITNTGNLDIFRGYSITKGNLVDKDGNQIIYEIQAASFAPHYLMLNDGQAYSFTYMKYEPESVKATEQTTSFANGYNIFGISDSNIDNGNFGIRLVTGELTNNQGNALILYPQGTTKGNGEGAFTRAILGTDLHRWNIVADVIDTAIIKTVDLYCTAAYVDGDQLATQSWVWKWIEELAKRIKDSSSGNTSALDKDWAAMGSFAANIKTSFTDIWFAAGTLDTEGAGFGNGYLSLPIACFNFTPGSGGAADTKPGEISKGWVNLDCPVSAILGDPVTEVDATTGEVTITLTSLNNNGTTRTINFNQADTTFYRKNVARYYKVDNWTGVGELIERDNNDNVSGTWRWDTNGYDDHDVDIHVYNDFGTEIIHFDLLIDELGAYVAGWNACFNAIEVYKEKSTDSISVAKARVSGGVTGCKNGTATSSQIFVASLEGDEAEIRSATGYIECYVNCGEAGEKYCSKSYSYARKISNDTHKAVLN